MADQEQPKGMNVDEGQFFDKYKPTQTEDEFFNKYDNQRVADTHSFWFNKGPYEGKTSDYFFQQNPVGRILSAFGQGAKDAWGQGDSSALGAEIKWEAEQKKADQGLVYGFHTSVMRPAAAAIDSLSKPVFAAGAGAAQAIGQTGEELSSEGEEIKKNVSDTFSKHPDAASVAGAVLSTPFGASGELLKGAASGAGLEGGLEGPRGSADHVQVLQDARSKGVIGEGEAGYFKTVVQAGEPYGPVTREGFLGPKLVPNEAEIARQIDPDTFKELDRLQNEQENLRASRDYTTSKILPKEEITDRGTYLEQERLQKSLQDVPERLQKIDEQIRDIITDVADAKKRSEELLESDSPEGHAFRNLIQTQAFEKAIALEEAKPKVQAAYRDAADIIPTEEPKNASPNNKPKSGESATTPPSAASQIISVLPEYRGGIKDVKGGSKSEAGLNKNMQIEAIQKGFEIQVGDTPLYNKLNHANQGQLGFDYVEANPKAAMEVGMGDRESPDEIHPLAILAALKEKAEAEGDIDMLQTLSHTRLGPEVSKAGQTLGLAKLLYNKIDPLEIIKGIQELWQQKGSEKITKTIEDIQDTIQKNMVDLHSQIGEFLKSIECDY